MDALKKSIKRGGGAQVPRVKSHPARRKAPSKKRKVS
jgi:hypothetical protein